MKKTKISPELSAETLEGTGTEFESYARTIEDYLEKIGITNGYTAFETPLSFDEALGSNDILKDRKNVGATYVKNYLVKSDLSLLAVTAVVGGPVKGETTYVKLEVIKRDHHDAVLGMHDDAVEHNLKVDQAIARMEKFNAIMAMPGKALGVVSRKVNNGLDSFIDHLQGGAQGRADAKALVRDLQRKFK